MEFLFNFFTSLIVWLTTEQKEKLSEVDQQLKKAEAAQRRKMQVEMAARESEVPLSISIMSLSLFWFFKIFRMGSKWICLQFCRLRQ